ncbi:MAG TPA: alpha/beta hydrolase [Symbiobacteriaceae bacterium]|jgi:pimeloyl-ACP methyl ester carboxylesterase
MKFRTWGKSGQPLVVLLHALGCHSGWWDWIGPRLGGEYQVVAPDFRGHGDSERAEEYRFDGYAADVAELVRSLGGGPYGLVGHSMGGYVGLMVAARRVLPPAALMVVDMKLEATAQELAGLQVAATRPSRTYRTLAEAAAGYRLSPSEHKVPPERLAAVAAQSFRPTDDGTWVEKLDRRALAIEPLTPQDLAAQITCPALFVRGEHSPVMPQEPALALARSLGAPLVGMLGLYHHLPLEAPEKLAGMIGRFLEDALPA